MLCRLVLDIHLFLNMHLNRLHRKLSTAVEVLTKFKLNLRVNSLLQLHYASILDLHVEYGILMWRSNQ